MKIFSKYFLVWAFFFVIIWGANSCSVFEDSPEMVIHFSEENSLKEMLRVSTMRGKVTLGTEDSTVKVDEQGNLLVSFDYIFFIGKHEVTCSEFNRLMKPAHGVEISCENKNFPAVNVTFYDAVLFANERSKEEHKDTVYTYKNIVFDNEGHVTNLEGYTFWPFVNGYRLPTEAEWSFVAEQNWNINEAWTADNSDYKIHTVCSTKKSERVCDMVGNALEWVNDWFGFLGKDSVYDFVGSINGGTQARRIVKGGSFKNAKENIKIYNRGDVYTVTSSTRASYVGFRLGFGAIPHFSWNGLDGSSIAGKVEAKIEPDELRSLLNSSRVKLAFRNDLSGNLVYMDFSLTNLYMVEFKDTIEVYHPEFSPDGRWIVYSTNFEGNDGPSSVYARDVGVDNGKRIKMSANVAAIPRWNVLENGDTVVTFVDNGGNNANEASFKNMKTMQSKFLSRTFKPSKKIFDGAYHDGVSADNKFAVTGARLLRAKVNGKDTIWYNGEQACNVSLSTDGSKRSIFLDFGGKTGRDFVGEKYGTHERILMVDSLGKLINSFKAPVGYSFDHTEWIYKNPNYGVATLTNVNGAHSKIVLVNFKDSTLTTLVEGDELWHPTLWQQEVPKIENKELDADSAGAYLTNSDDLTGVIMRNNMELLWQNKDTADLVILGSSRPLNGINPKMIRTVKKGINLAQTPNSMYMNRDYLDKYIFNHVKNLKYIIVSLDIDFWWKENNADGENFFVSTYKNYPGYVYDENHNFWKDGMPSGLLEYTKNSLNASDEHLFKQYDGCLYMNCLSWGGVPEIDIDSTLFDSMPYLIENTMSALKDIIEKAKMKNIYVVGIIFPQSPAYKNTGAFGRYGLRRSKAKELIKEFKNMETKYSNFKFMDENKMGNHDYKDIEAANYDHLCEWAVPKITRRLDSLLKTLE